MVCLHGFPSDLGTVRLAGAAVGARRGAMGSARFGVVALFVVVLGFSVLFKGGPRGGLSSGSTHLTAALEALLDSLTLSLCKWGG